MTEQIETPSVTAYIEAYAADDHGVGPAYATFNASDALIEELLELQQLCADHGLSEVRVFRACNWGPGDLADQLRLQNHELVVCNGYFWLRADVKHANYHVETRAQDIDNFVETIRGCAPGDTPRFGEYDDEDWAEALENEDE